MRHILEEIRRLAVYSFGTDKELDKDGNGLVTKALRLPESLKYLEDKDDFFSPDSVEKISRQDLRKLLLKEQTNQNLEASIRMGTQGEEETKHLRTHLAEGHSLFLANIIKINDNKSLPISPVTIANWIKVSLKEAEINNDVFKAHSLRSIHSVKMHAN
ncbi:hypothetical protein G6F37_012458 [Rhizopus arrhizus]|nr:hypothetical protein G6F38_012485 [Rhizopus arrhizus]KAG1143496.1 hypothetical protein G6F37_012458 [Rhizopus arrhizus]